MHSGTDRFYMDIPPLYLLELSFKVTSPISNLPHYHGPHISALFRNLLKSYLPENETLSSALIVPVPVDTGNSCFSTGEVFHVYLTYPERYHRVVTSFIHELSARRQDNAQLTGGDFVLGKTLILEDARCRIRGESIFESPPLILNQEHINQEIELLKELKEFSILFYTPLRLLRPKGNKTQGHRYCDYLFFFEPDEGVDPVRHLLQAVEARLARYDSEDSQRSSLFKDYDSSLKITDGGLFWIDCPYGYEPVKTIGGVVGTIRISGSCSHEEACALVIGQYVGIGKNTSFGFGAFLIPELNRVKKIKVPKRGKTLIERCLTVENLQNALLRLPNSSPGVDGISVSDVKKAGKELLERLRQEVLSGKFSQKDLKKYRLPKEGGKFREIYVQCATDRLIHKTISDFLTPIIDGLLLNCAWAYRKGLNRKGAAEALIGAISEGYTNGIKADIATFFESVNVKKLFFILEGLFPFEPLVETLKCLIEHFRLRGIKGLPQGSPISPVLSNLYLTCFDRDMEREGFRLIRYSDDLVILSKDGLPKELMIEKIRKSLSRLDLNLKEEKIEEVKGNNTIHFLGYLVSKDELIDDVKDGSGSEDEWTPLFRDDWVEGQPVYLTSLIKVAYSNGPDLVVKSDDETLETIPWSRISRLVVVGRAPVSGGVIYRAVKEEVPVCFIDVLGRQRALFYPESKEIEDLGSLQADLVNDRDFCLAFAKEIISAKIHNSAVLLARNGIESGELKELEKKVKDAESLEQLRGYEGTAARIYFSEYAHLVEPFEFKGRMYHPPDGPVNVMLSFGYTLLYNRLTSMLKNKGFNPRLGFYHKGRGSHNALASDLLEELRHIAERVVLSLIHLKEVTKDEFCVRKRKGMEICRMEGSAFRKFIKRFEKTMAQKATYHGGERMSYNAFLDEMGNRLRRTLRLEIPYRAFRID